MTNEEQLEAEQYLESYVRKLRDRIYGYQSDAGWNSCKNNWLTEENVKWLEEQAAKVKP